VCPHFEVSTSATVSALVADAGSTSNDRITTFTYDLDGNKLTETRENVEYWSLSSEQTTPPTGSSGNSTVTYTYNGLGEITSVTQATGDKTSYTYDTMGRLSKTIDQSYTNYAGTTVEYTTENYYNGLSEVVRTSQFDSDNSGGARATTYTYGANGWLATMTDNDGFVRTYGYDADGRTVSTSYSREQSNGTYVTNADVTQYDALGRQIMQTVAAYTYNGSTWTWTFGDEFGTTYDAFGDAISKSVDGMAQETFAYDNAGRLWQSTEDGVTGLFLYDGDGNQTLAITSDGNALSGSNTWSNLTIAQALNLLTDNGTQAIGAAAVQGMVATIGVYDNRGQSTETIEPQREVAQAYNSSTYALGAYTTQTITTSRAYDAFGDVVAQTDGNDNTTKK
jgi:YD repeat-containing protein